MRRVVLKSTSEVYGSTSRDPVLFTEDSSRRRPPGEGFARDSIDIEGYARGLGRRRSDIAVTILRLANMIGPAMDTALSRYLAGPVVPTVVGHDARLQLLHEQDALGALERATMAGQAGHVQRRRVRDHHDESGHPALRPDTAAGAAVGIVGGGFAMARDSLH